MINVQLGSKQEEKPPKPFPKFMKSVLGDIVLFSSPDEGMLIKNVNTGRCEGNFYMGWAMDCFTDYNEPVTLQNA